MGVRFVNILNLDMGDRQGGLLTIMNIRTKKYWQSDLAEELYRVISAFSVNGFRNPFLI
jgi:hypothetical protein